MFKAQSQSKVKSLKLNTKCLIINLIPKQGKSDVIGLYVLSICGRARSHTVCILLIFTLPP